VTGNNEASVDVSVSITNAAGTLTRNWDFGAGRYAFWRNGIADPSTRDESDHWYMQGDHLEFLPNQYQTVRVFDPGLGPPVLSGNDVIQFASRVTPIEQRSDGTPVGWEVRPDELGYLLGPVAIAPPRGAKPLPVQIDALVYAQNGSWFIIPGPWFNEDPDELRPGEVPTSLYPGYHEPLNIRLSFYGAITENMPADLGAVAEWTSKWSGPVGQGEAVGQGEEYFLSYGFDPLLRFPRRETEDRIGYLRFPNFPITSDLVIWGERVSGPAGT